MARPIDVVRRAAPDAKQSYLAAIENGDALFQQHGLTTPDRLAHFLAQILHESGGLKVELENMNYSAPRLFEIFGVGHHSARVTPDEAQRLEHHPPEIAERVYGLGNPTKAQELGNTQPGDGFRYRGGGLMQTTGRSNYRRMGQKCQVDFENKPELVLSDQHALKPALTEWSEQGLNAFADNNDILSISRAINLGNPRSSRTPNGMEDRTRWFAKVRPNIDRVDFSTGAAPQPADTPPTDAAPAGQPPQAGGAVAALAPQLGGKLLKMGNKGDLVRVMQLALAKLGYPLSGTGYFGGATDTAVTDFQEKNGLEVDGVVGPDTAKAIDKAVASGGAGSPAGTGGTAHAAGQPGGASPPRPGGDGDRPLWLIEGLKWLNTDETQGAVDNPEILEWAREEGGAIAQNFKHDSIPWCALFANMVLTKVGIKGTETLWALDWANWGKKLGGPAVGAFAPMKREGGGHIAIVVGRDQRGNLMCLGGNQDDAVNIKPFPAARPLGFRWPSDVAPPAAVGFDKLPLVKSDGVVSKREG